MADIGSDDSVREKWAKFAGLLDKLQGAVEDYPESAAKLVSVLCRQQEAPGPLAQIAITIAQAYEAAFGDDSLVIEVSNAPWFQKVTLPYFVEDGAEMQPPPDIFTTRLGEADDDSIRILQVNQEDLRAGSIEGIMNMFDFATADAERARRLEALWGKAILAFPLDDDPRYIAEIPEARSYIAKIHKALPYFPAFLNYHPAAGMFYVYFGSLADLEAVTAPPGQIDLMHPSVVIQVAASILAIGALARGLQKDPRPVWQDMLAVYPEPIAKNLVAGVYEKIWGEE